MAKSIVTGDVVTVQCKGCGVTFDISVDEQKWYENKGFGNLPKRCRKCRKERRKERKDVQQSAEI